MKSQKGMSYKMLVICIFLLIVLVISVVYFLHNQVKSEKIKTYQTDMLLVQGKVKVLSQESTMQKQEDILKGEKLTDKLEEEWVKELLEKQIINQDEENFSKYYIWNKDILNDVGLQDIKLENGFYIVNYETDEVIYSEGINIDDKIYYKLSEITNNQLEEKSVENEQ